MRLLNVTLTVSFLIVINCKIQLPGLVANIDPTGNVAFGVLVSLSLLSNTFLQNSLQTLITPFQVLLMHEQDC